MYCTWSCKDHVAKKTRSCQDDMKLQRQHESQDNFAPTRTPRRTQHEDTKATGYMKVSKFKWNNFSEENAIGKSDRHLQAARESNRGKSKFCQGCGKQTQEETRKSSKRLEWNQNVQEQHKKRNMKSQTFEEHKRCQCTAHAAARTTLQRRHEAAKTTWSCKDNMNHKTTLHRQEHQDKRNMKTQRQHATWRCVNSNETTSPQRPRAALESNRGRSKFCQGCV